MFEMNQGRGGAFGKELLTIDLGAGNRRLSLARPQFWNGIRALPLRVGSWSEQGLLSGWSAAHIAVGSPSCKAEGSRVPSGIPGSKFSFSLQEAEIWLLAKQE